MKRPFLAAVLLVAGVGLTACGSSSSSPAVVASTAPKKAQHHDMGSMAHPKQGPTAPGAKVTFETPHTGQSESGTVTAVVHLHDFLIDPKAVGMSPRPGHGHLHFALDNGKYDFPRYSGPNGEIAKKLGVEGVYSPSLTPRITYKHLPVGKHTLFVYLANNNHTRTGIYASTTFTVR